MKKILFFFTMLASVAASAQTGITVMPISTDYTNQTVGFSVSWLNSSRTGTHNSKVWVFVDYRTITGNVPSGSWTRALISGTPTATTGTPSRETGNDKGFWLQGTSGSSGTYNATVTVKLSGVPAKFNWCAYVSDYPPNVTVNNGTYTFKGTPPFILKDASGNITQTIPEKTLPASSLITSPVPVILTDKTECPGVFCIYRGSDLYIDPTHLCQQRTSGAQNWEAWIKDTRDAELYRIVLMPDNNWWLAQNLKYAGTGASITVSGCTKENCGRWYTGVQSQGSYGGTSGYGENKQGVCPNGWFLPVCANWHTLSDKINPNRIIAARELASKECSCTTTDEYTFTASKCIHRSNDVYFGCTYKSNNSQEMLYETCPHQGLCTVDTEGGDSHVVRCFRRL